MKVGGGIKPEMHPLFSTTYTVHVNVGLEYSLLAPSQELEINFIMKRGVGM